MARIQLNKALEGSTVRIKNITPVPAARSRLCAFGITPGAEIEICSQQGACQIRVQNANVALCHELACCIECEIPDFSLKNLIENERQNDNHPKEDSFAQNDEKL